MPRTEGLVDRLSAAAQPGEPWPVLVLSLAATTRVALALFDDADRAKRVLPRLNREAKGSADTFRWWSLA